jgi:hypothetical protein
MRLPAAIEINPIPEDLDGQHAVRNFLGKSLEEAEALFRESAITYSDDLLVMGESAFRFYVPAAASYIQSEAAMGDSDAVSCFAGLLEHRLEFGAEELAAVAPLLASACRHILQHYESFDITLAIYGDLRPRFRALEQTLLRQMPL